MSSTQFFELVNSLHNQLALDNAKKNPFGGKRLVIVGGFLQLKHCF